MSNVLIATLGESPIVITTMFDKLAEQEGIAIDRVVIVYPQGEYVEDACAMVEEVLPVACDLIALPFEDANGKAESFQFLHELYQQLSQREQQRDDVYLSLAGGRKNMSALLALLAPLFPCIKGLYHILDLDDQYFLDIIDLNDYQDSQLKRVFRPDVSKLVLVKIPFGEHQRVSKEYRSRLFTITDEQWDEWWEMSPAQAEGAEFACQFLRQDVMGEIIDVWVTEHVEHEYQRMCKSDITHAKEFARCFRQMQYATRLYGGIHIYHGLESPFYFYKRHQSQERPLFYIESRKNTTGLSKVVITGLAVKRGDKYDPPVEQLKMLPVDPKMRIDGLLSEELIPAEDAPIPMDSVLVVPLGETPMIATQFYALRQKQGRKIHEIIVLYPQRSLMITTSLQKVREALAGDHVKVREFPVPLEDLTSTGDCEIYLQALVKTIEETQRGNPHCQIELSLSGGRKGMAALAMFAAQQTGLRYVYHTLIEDRELFKRLEKETDIKALNQELIKQRRIDRLLLRAYTEDIEKFTLFEVPVLPPARK